MIVLFGRGSKNLQIKKLNYTRHLAKIFSPSYIYIYIGTIFFYTNELYLFQTLNYGQILYFITFFNHFFLEIFMTVENVLLKRLKCLLMLILIFDSLN